MSCESHLCDSGRTGLYVGCAKGELIDSIKVHFGLQSNCSILGGALEETPLCNSTMAQDILSECTDERDCIINATKIVSKSCEHATSLTAQISCQSPDDSSGIDILTVLVLVLYCCISFALGTTLTLDLFRQIWKEKRVAFVIGWCSQFGFMPLMAFVLSHAFQLDSLIAIGVVLVGSAPGGSTSNLMTYWVDGNVSLSIAMSTASTLCSLFMLPMLWVVYIETGFARGKSIKLPFTSILITLLTIIVPVLCGLYVRYVNTHRKCGPSQYRLLIHEWFEKIGSVLGALFLIAAMATGIRDHPELMNPSEYPKEWIIAAMFQPLGCGFGYLMAYMLRLSGDDCRAICLETGVQSYPMVLAVTSLSFSGCTRTMINTFPYISGVWYVVSSAWILVILKAFSPRTKPTTVGGKSFTNVQSIPSAIS